MIALEETSEFKKWFKSLKSQETKARIQYRIHKLETQGHFGDIIKRISDTLFEMRFFFGAGYLIYYIKKDDLVILLLVGGDKTTQEKDIQKAIEIAGREL
jgi:putative addiction module killer protein